MADVFISYSRRDFEFVRRLADALQARGKEVWIDIEGLRDAEVFPAALRVAIESSDSFVFVITPASVRSEYCINEVEHAVQTGKRIVPVALRDVPDTEVPEAIRVRNWIRAEAMSAFEIVVDRVVTALDTDLDHLRAHTRWEVKALEWRTEGRDKSILLRGAELGTAETWLAGAVGKDPEPTPLQRDYLLASRQAVTRRQRVLVAVSAAVAAGSLALLAFALIQRGQALTERSKARSAQMTDESRALAFESESQQAVDPERAVLIAIEAVKAKATPDALFALRAAIDNDPLTQRLPGIGVQRCSELGPSVTYDPSGSRIVEGTCQGTVRVIESRSGRTLRTLNLGDPAVPVRLSRDGSLLAIATAGAVLLYDWRTLTPRRRLTTPGHPERIAFSADGSLVGTTSRDGAGRSWARVWTTTDGRSRWRLSSPPHNGGANLRGIAFVQGDSAVVVGHDSGPAAVIRLDSGRPERTLAGTQRTSDVAVSDNGGRLAVGNDQSQGPQSQVGLVTVWDTRNWRQVGVIVRQPGNAPSSVAFSPDGSRLAVGWYDGSAGVWALITRARLATFLGPAGPVSTAAYSRDGAHVLVAAADGSLRVWRGGGGETAYFQTGSRADWFIPGLADGLLTLVTLPNVVSTWRTSDFHPVRRLRTGRPGNFRNAWLSDDGRLALMSRTDGALEVWDVDGRRQLLVLPNRAGAVLAATRDDRRLAVLDGNRNEIVDLATGGVLRLRGRAASCPGEWQSADFSRDGVFLVGGTGCGQSLVWDVRTGAAVNRLDVGAELAGLAVAPSGNIIAVASQDGRLTLWDRLTGVRRLIGAFRGVDSLAFSGDGEFLVSGGVDNTIHVVDSRSGRLLRTMRVQNPVGVRFGSDGHTLISSELSGVIRLWRTCPHCHDARRLLAEARATVTRPLTPSERRTYLSGF